MAVKIYRYNKETGTVVLVGERLAPSIPRDTLRHESNFISPVTRKEIRNKYELHDHNLRHNVEQTTDGHMQDWDVAQKKRDDFFIHGNPAGKEERIEAIIHTIDTLTKQGEKR